MSRGSSDDGPAEEPGDQDTHGDHGRVTCRLARHLAKLRPRAHAVIEIRLKFSRPAPTVLSTTPSRSHRHAQRWAVAEQAAPEVVGEERRGQPAEQHAVAADPEVGDKARLEVALKTGFDRLQI